jgi:acyl-CoA carboxylase subunit beta
MTEIRLRTTRNLIGFPGYSPPERESATASVRQIGDHELVVIEFDFSVLGGSMGLATGETICQAFELATGKGLPVLAITRSGGARMQEGMFSLAQMPATLQARNAFRQATGLPFIAWLRHPTTGGVFASFANTADLILAEPGATIGFAGPRVAAAFTGQELPKNSHTAESALQHGLVNELAASEQDLVPHIDAAVGETISGGNLPEAAQLWAYTGSLDHTSTQDAWAAVTASRDANRRSWLLKQLDDLDPLTERVAHGFRSGFRIVATRGLVLEPEDFAAIRHLFADHDLSGTPMLLLVDVPGANPSAQSEAAGIAREIAFTMSASMNACFPLHAIVTGEGGSGGALALCAGADSLAVCENAYFSVIAPEGATAILRRDDVSQVAKDLRCGPDDLVGFGLADALLNDEQLIEILNHPDSVPDPVTAGKNRWRNPGRALTDSVV